MAHVSALFAALHYHMRTIGKALLYGPGSIMDAHSRTEHIKTVDITSAVAAYKQIARLALNA
jgi:acetylornithine deacetylase/succinyl-diaminopimelate desuccinylase-like protein